MAQAGEALRGALPDDPHGWFFLGLAAIEAGRVSMAVGLLEAAVARGGSAAMQADYARALILARRDAEAKAMAAQALASGPDDALSFDTIGCVLARLGDHEASVAPFEAAIARAPDDPGYRYNLAAACGFTGRIDAARAHYETLLAAQPNHARAHYALAILSRQTAEANHIPRLENALTATRDAADGQRIRYALAKEHEDIGDHAASFAHLARANAERKATLGYSFEQDAAIFDAIEAAFADRRALSGPGNPDAAPIFVVGMPRTGTTLVDRILSSHPDVASAGELQAMPLAVKQLAATRSRIVVDAETIRASAAADPAQIARLYLDRAAPHRPAGSPRFTDKLPANFLYIGHIARALPNARIMCLRRNPMDTVWSNFKNLFAAGSSYYFYSNDLLDTARYYHRFDRLMAYWEQLFPGRVLQLGYETLVADQEAQTRRLLAHCGLDWSDACLNFHENRAAVATPSAAQVRRPMNADAVGRWRVHDAALAPVRDWFAANGIAVNQT